MTPYRSGFISCDFDFDAKGKHYGAAHLDYSNDEGVSRVFPIPIVSITNGDGPTVLLTAGNHGNEDEGQLILRRLIADISPEDIRGGSSRFRRSTIPRFAPIPERRRWMEAISTGVFQLAL